MVDVLNVFAIRNMSTFEMIQYNIDAARDKVDFALSDKALLNTVKSGEKFDLFMMDIFLDDALLG